MQPSRYEQIIKLVKTISDACNITIPADEEEMRRVVNLLGGEYEVNDDHRCEASIEKTGDESFKIVMWSKHNPLRRNFSIAHELGHLFLHMGFLINEEKWKGRGTSQIFYDSARDRLTRSVAEEEADVFAGALLMPGREYERVANRHVKMIEGKEYYEVDKVAQYFNVSLQAALYRGRRLELFPWG